MQFNTFDAHRAHAYYMGKTSAQTPDNDDDFETNERYRIALRALLDGKPTPDHVQTAGEAVEWFLLALGGELGSALSERLVSHRAQMNRVMASGEGFTVRT